MQEEIDQILEKIFTEKNLLMASLSSPREKETEKISIRPVSIKGNIHYQWTEFRQNQAFHQNFTAEQCKTALHERIWAFKQILLCTSETDYHILIGKKFNVTILKKPPSKLPKTVSHNRKKEYLLEEGKAIPFLVELDVMNPQGKVYPQKRDKFRQINRFLEMVDDVMSAFDPHRPLHIVDFGCGKAYLTFALYYYLKEIKEFNVTLEGVDLKTDVIRNCQDLAIRLGYQGLTFVRGDIEGYQGRSQVDMVVSLHACDTATDAALEKALQWNAKAILSVPCCQHELFKQIANPSLEPLLKHGILKERFAALATDAARAQLLEALGYQTQVLEFIDVEHTPKNLLIRAIRHGKPSSEAWESYLEFKKHLRIDPALERFLESHLRRVFG